jgi:uncharacterized protein with GYD domain
MAKYLVEANYTQSGVAGLTREGGTSRRAAVEKALASIGGTLDSFYYAFGDTDLFGVIDVPDNVAAAAFSLITNSPGTVNVRLRPLLTPEELDRATQIHPDYRPPGA